MAQAKKQSEGSIKATVTTNGDEKVEFEPVKAIEEETLASIKGQKTFILVILKAGNPCPRTRYAIFLD